MDPAEEIKNMPEPENVDEGIAVEEASPADQPETKTEPKAEPPQPKQPDFSNLEKMVAEIEADDGIDLEEPAETTADPFEEAIRPKPGAGPTPEPTPESTTENDVDEGIQLDNVPEHSESEERDELGDTVTEEEARVPDHLEYLTAKQAVDFIVNTLSLYLPRGVHAWSKFDIPNIRKHVSNGELPPKFDVLTESLNERNYARIQVKDEDKKYLKQAYMPVAKKWIESGRLKMSPELIAIYATVQVAGSVAITGREIRKDNKSQIEAALRKFESILTQHNEKKEE